MGLVERRGGLHGLIALAGLSVAVGGALAGCSLLFPGDPFSCGPFADQALARLPTAVPSALPQYRFMDEYNECDSGGGRGSRFTLVDPTGNGEALLRAVRCQVTLAADDLTPVFSCELSGERVTAELEDPDLWVRPAR